MTNKFNFYDVVEIVSIKKKLEYFNGKIGIIRGISGSEDNPNLFAYSVDILNEKGEVEECKFIFEEDLRATGKKADKAKMYTDMKIKIRTNSKTGESEVIKDD